MDKLRSESPLGTLELRARDADVVGEGRELVLRLARDGARAAGFVELAGGRAFVKASPLAGRARLRWALKRALFQSPLPREREHANLLWLRERLFLAPEPLLSAVIARGGAPWFQALATRAVEPARTLEDVLRDGGATERAYLLDELARETARMHALHFVHRDLYPRNVLVHAEPSGGCTWFLDCWKGGERLQLRGPAYDLACFLLRAPEDLGAEAQRAFLDAYERGRAAQGKPIGDRAPFLRAIERERAALVQRLAARPGEWRGRSAPIARWPIA
ncbi:MAG: phosphotransferase [Planctomycetes bacterium]|nr:phosphotransferase [Planctomycetota bacterium]